MTPVYSIYIIPELIKGAMEKPGAGKSSIKGIRMEPRDITREDLRVSGLWRYGVLKFPNPDKPEPNPNSEIRNSKQIQMTKKEKLKRLW